MGTRGRQHGSACLCANGTSDWSNVNTSRQIKEVVGRRRRDRLRVLTAFGTGLAVLALGTGCGGGSAKGKDVAAEVAGQEITAATLKHWIPIEAVISKESVPTHPTQAGEVPDPPRYTACIAYTRKAGSAGTQSPAKMSTKQLEMQCRQRYESVRKHMLQILITFRWLAAEATAQGVEVSDQEVDAAFARFTTEYFKDAAGLRRFLKFTGATLQDERLIVKMDQLSSKLQRKVLQERGIAGAGRFFQEFPRRWTAKTECNSGYVIPECKQYKGPEHPEASI
jgi:hypothetical protein